MNQMEKSMLSAGKYSCGWDLTMRSVSCGFHKMGFFDCRANLSSDVGKHRVPYSDAFVLFSWWLLLFHLPHTASGIFTLHSNIDLKLCGKSFVMKCRVLTNTNNLLFSVHYSIFKIFVYRNNTPTVIQFMDIFGFREVRWGCRWHTGNCECSITVLPWNGTHL